MPAEEKVRLFRKGFSPYVVASKIRGLELTVSVFDSVNYAFVLKFGLTHCNHELRDELGKRSQAPSRL